MTTVLVIDGFIDEPASLGVPPFISPQVRAVVGAARDAAAEVAYLTIEDLRRGNPVPNADLSVLMAGSAVPGRYLRALPASRREIEGIGTGLGGLKVLGGPASVDPAFRDSTLFDEFAERDAAAAVYDMITKGRSSNRWRTLAEWNRWMISGAGVVKDHPDYPYPLTAEIETYRGCIRYRSGGCSFCVEPLKGPPAFREPADIVEEVRTLLHQGVRNFRLGAQTCFVSYKATIDGEYARPNPKAVEELLSGISALGPDLVHLDNANPAVMSDFPQESREILESIVAHCTSGNVLALGMESADPVVIEKNNLNATPEQVLDAIRMMNEIGAERGETGLPKLLPGLNFIVGLDGESRKTLNLNLEFLRSVAEEGLMLRRINIRQVLPVRREFRPGVSHSEFIKFKERVREEIDRPMLQRIVPIGTLLPRVLTELREGNRTFGRQIGTYPLLVGFEYPIEICTLVNAMVVGWGYRSVTAAEHPLPVNACSLGALASLPSIGRKRAARIFRRRPLRDTADLAEALDDAKVAETVAPFLSFSER